jgi:protein-S-isoprenylcysteine O-methyltransferase Ste14
VRDIGLAMAILTAYHWNTPMAAIGLALAALGLSLQTWSKAVLRRNRQLNSTGPYAICRHPFYLGNLAFDLGLCCLSGNLWLVGAYPIVFAVGYYSTFRHEEDLLRTLFGERHKEYCARTPMLRPSLLGLCRRWSSPCSFSVFAREKQLSRGTRLLSYPLAVWLSARLWNAQSTMPDDLSLFLLMSIVALALASSLIYSNIENLHAHSLASTAGRILVRFGVPLCALAPVALTAVLEQDAGDVLLAGCFSLVLLGVWIAGSSSPALVRKGRGRSGWRFAVLTVEVVVLAGGLWLNQMLWLLPVAVVLLVAGTLIQQPVRGLCRTSFPLTLLRVTGTAILVIGVVPLASASHVFPGVSDPVAESLHKVAAPGALVAVVADRDFTVYGGREWLDRFIVEEDLVLLLASGKHPTFLLVDPDDLSDLGPAMADRLRLEGRVRSWFDEYQLLRILDNVEPRRTSGR